LPSHFSSTSHNPFASRQTLPDGNNPAPPTPTGGHNDYTKKNSNSSTKHCIANENKPVDHHIESVQHTNRRH
jgi:hypothetical protein